MIRLLVDVLVLVVVLIGLERRPSLVLVLAAYAIALELAADLDRWRRGE